LRVWQWRDLWLADSSSFSIAVGTSMAQPLPTKAAQNSTKKQHGGVVPRYFLSGSWASRLSSAIAARASTQSRDFAAANVSRVKEHLTLEKSLRVVFNLHGYALLNYLRTGDYKNIYEGPEIAGEVLRPSQTRLRADNLVGLHPARDYYFCALASGGTGLRYYGTYCAVLKPAATKGRVVRIFDRNSYDLLTPPLKTYLETLQAKGKSARLVDGLMSRFDDESTQTMLATKVLQRTADSPHLLTAGTVADAILSDEDYCEAYHQGKIDIVAIEELREHPADVSRETELLQRLKSGEFLRPEEVVWAARRRRIRQEVRRLGLPRSVSANSGRSGRGE
jgi:hypothetical protein